MINLEYKEMLNNKSIIRQLSEYAVERGKEIGYENVFDYSLGNPSVPCPQNYTEKMIELLKGMNPMELHGYSPSISIPSVRKAVAESLNRRFGMTYGAEHIFMTSGAAGAIAHAVRAVTKPGDEVLTFAPCFPEYKPYVSKSGAVLKIVPPDEKTFQIHFEKFEEMLNEKVMAVLVNSPNNPSGIVYSEETIQKLARILSEKQREYGHDIFLISDEPYREIVFDGKQAPYMAAYYDNTLTCYSFSKSLSLPGERIGYIAVNPRCTDAELLVPIFAQISRGIGHNCPASSVQYAVAKVLDEVSDLSIYETNRNLLYQTLTELGFEVVKPDGTFYIFPRALEEDADSFCMKAREYDLILVPAGNFGCPHHFRMAYCIDTEKVERSIPALRRFVKEQYGRE